MTLEAFGAPGGEGQRATSQTEGYRDETTEAACQAVQF